MEVAGNFSFENIFESISEPVSVHDRNFRIVRANEAMCSLLGMDRHSIIGRECYDVFHKTDSPWEVCPHVKALESGEAEIETINDPNLPSPVVVSCSPITDFSGKIQGTVHIVRKLSDINRIPVPSHDIASALPGLKALQGYLVICASCHKIKDEHGSWDKIEEYINMHASVLFSHGICPECYGEFKEGLKKYQDMLPA